MREIINSGNSTVDAMVKINLTGNIIPANWFRTITRDNGKPYMLAICILSELCYWYRPQEVRDERSGNIVEYRKRFRGDMLQKNYQDLADRFGESKRSVKAATDRLEELGVIRKEWRNLKLRNGAVINNVLFIDLNVDILSGITFGYPESGEEISSEITESEENAESEEIENPEEFENPIEPEVLDKSEKSEAVADSSIDEEVIGTVPMYDPVAEYCNIQLHKNESYEEKNQVIQNSEIPVTEKEDMDIHFKAGPLTISRDTNTKNTSENTVESKSENIRENKRDFINYRKTSNHILSDNNSAPDKIPGNDRMDKLDIVRDMLKENVSYDYIVMSDNRYKKMLDEIIEIMAETIVDDRKVMISGIEIPHSIIQSRFEKYDYSMMMYVLESLDANTTKVINVRKYILATLYNAPATMNISLNMKVKNALYG